MEYSGKSKRSSKAVYRKRRIIMADKKLTKEQIDLLENFPVDPCIECDL